MLPAFLAGAVRRDGHLILSSAKLGVTILLDNFWPNGYATGCYYQIQIEDISTDLQLEVLLVKK
jgi:hypothetical protein